MRVAWVIVLVLLGCAGQTKRPEHPDGDDALHDPARDWQSARPIDPVPVRPPAPALEPVEPPPLLREFTEDEVKRIRGVQRHVHAAAVEHQVPPDIVNGVIWVESKFEHRARGRKGPRGLMQLMPRTAREVASQLRLEYAPFDPEFNIHAGTFYLARMVERFDGNLALALAAYNIGPAYVDQWVRLGEPLPEVSRRYIDLVFIAARAFREREP